MLLIVLHVGYSYPARALDPPSEDVGTKVKTLWEGNSLTELRLYLQGVSSGYPDYAPAIAASAFYDYIFLGKLNDANSKLQRLKTASQTNAELFSSESKRLITAVLREVNDEIRVHTERGDGEQQWQANANPGTVRSTWGIKYHPSIDLILPLPKTFLTPQ